MFLSHKSNVIQFIEENEWNCRRKTKNLTKPEYWTWIATITDADGVVTYPSETFTIVECTDEDVQVRLNQLGDYISMDGVYNIKWSDAKVDGSHFSGDDTAKTARLLADEWTRIRKERTRLLAETDYLGNSDVTMSVTWKTYRKSLRDLPTDQSSKTKYSDITWPSKP